MSELKWWNDCLAFMMGLYQNYHLFLSIHKNVIHPEGLFALALEIVVRSPTLGYTCQITNNIMLRPLSLIIGLKVDIRQDVYCVNLFKS